MYRPGENIRVDLFHLGKTHRNCFVYVVTKYLLKNIIRINKLWAKNVFGSGKVKWSQNLLVQTKISVKYIFWLNDFYFFGQVKLLGEGKFFIRRVFKRKYLLEKNLVNILFFLSKKMLVQ